MMNKSSNTIVKRMRAITEIIVFAMLFIIVFGIAFTSETLSDYSMSNSIDQGLVQTANAATIDPTFGGPDFQETYSKNAAGALRDDKDGLLGASDFGFPGGDAVTSWKSPDVKFSKGKPSGSISLYVLQETRVWEEFFQEQVAKPEFSNMSIADQPKNKKGDAVTGYGFTLATEKISGNAFIAMALNIELSPFLKQLLNDGRYTVTATINQSPMYLQWIEDWKYQYLAIKTKNIATPELFNASDIPYVNKNEGETDEQFKNRLFGERNKGTLNSYWSNLDYDYSESYTGTVAAANPANEHADDPAESNVVLTKDNPNLVLTYLFGTTSKNEKAHNIMRVSNLKIKYTINYNPNYDRTKKDSEGVRIPINDGAAPTAIGVSKVGNTNVLDIAPYMESEKLPAQNRQGMYDNSNKKIQDSLPYDTIKYGNNLSEDIFLSSYTNTTLKENVTKADTFYKRIAIDYQDQYYYESLDVFNSQDRIASGIRKVEISAKNSRKNLSFTQSSTTDLVKMIDITNNISNVGINVYDGTNIVAVINVSTVKNDKQKNAVSKVNISYEFADNLDISVAIYDFNEDSNPNGVYRQNISVSGIDYSAPNEIIYQALDDEKTKGVTDSLYNYTASTDSINNWFASAKWTNNSVQQFLLDANNQLEDNTSKYAWYVSVLKKNSYESLMLELSKFNISDKKTELAEITAKTLLEVQGRNALTKINYDFINGMFKIEGSSETVKMAGDCNGCGYYAFCFYTIDLAGNFAPKKTTVFIKVDYVAPKYTINIPNSIKESYFSGIDNKISGSKWAYDDKDFKVTLKLSDMEGLPLNSVSGNYLKFYVDDQMHMMLFNKNEIISIDGVNINGIKLPYKNDKGLSFDFDINFLKDAGPSIEFSFVNIYERTNDAKPQTINTTLKFIIGVGDATIDVMEYVDKTYKYQKDVDSAVAQDVGIKIRIEKNKPNIPGFSNMPEELQEGVYDRNKYTNAISGLNSRIWNNSGLLPLNLKVDRDSIVYVAIANGNVLSNPKYVLKDYKTELQNAITNVRTKYELDLMVNSFFHNSGTEAMVFSSTDTSTSKVQINLPLFVDLYGAGIRNIYIWVANEAGIISDIVEKNVLVDTTLYNVNTILDDAEREFFGITNEVEFSIKNSSIVHRGDKVKFNIVFKDKSFIPYTINGIDGLTSNLDESVLFENANKKEKTNAWDNTLVSVLDSQYITINSTGEIELIIDSVLDLADVIKKDPIDSTAKREKPVTDVTYTLHIRKNVNFGVSGSMDPITVPANKNGTNVKFWSSDAKALDNLIVEYFDSTGVKTIVGGPITPGNYTFSAYFVQDDPYYVSDIKFDKIKLVLEKYKVVLKIKSSNGFYGDTPVFQYGFFDVDGSLIEEPTGYDKNKQYLEIVGPKGVNQNRIPVGTYDIKVVDREDLSLRKDLSDYDIVVENNTYTVNPRVIQFSQYGTKSNGSYVLGVSKLYKAAMPEVYIFIDKEQFKDGNLNEASYFNGTDYATLFNNLSYQNEEFISGQHTYVVFKDILHSIDLPNVNVDTIPGTYNFSRDISKVVTNQNINVISANNQFMTIDSRQGIELTMGDQTIYVSGDTFKDNTYFGNLNYTVNDSHKDLLNVTGFIENIPFKLTLIEGNTYSVEVDKTKQDEYLGVIKIVGNPIITVYDMSKYFENLTPEDKGKQYVFTQQLKTPSLEYGLLKSGEYAFIDNTIIDDFARCFNFIVLEYTDNGMIEVNKGLSSFKLQIQVTDLSVNPGSHKASIDGGKMLSSSQEELKNTEFVKTSITINIINKTLYVTPILKGNGKDFNTTFGVDVKDVFAGVNILDKSGKTIETVLKTNLNAKSVDIFELALFNRDTFVKFATQYDDVLTNIDYHYGIVSTAQYSDEKYQFTDFIFDNTKNAYYIVDEENNIDVTEQKIKDIEVKIVPMQLTINKSSFDTAQFVGKPYDGNNKYYNPKYNVILQNSVFGNTSIIFDISYNAISGTTYVVINNIRVNGNINNINIILEGHTNITLEGKEVGQFSFEEKPVNIERLTITISQEDIVVKKAFDGTNTISPEDIILPSALSNMKFNVSNQSVFDGIMVGDAHRIANLILEFPNIDRNYVEQKTETTTEGSVVTGITGINGVEISYQGNKMIVSINGKKGTITKRIINADDIESIAPVNKTYDGTPDVKLSVQFKDHIAKEVQSLRNHKYYVSDDLDMIFMGQTYFNGEIDPNAHNNVQVRINKVLCYDYDTEKNVDYDNAIFDVDLEHIKQRFNGIGMTMDVYKALLTPVLKLGEQKYNNKTEVANIEDYRNTETTNIETTVNLGPIPKLNMTILDSKLSNEGQEFANVVKNTDTGINIYKHNILVKAKLSVITDAEGNISVTDEELSNYSLNGFSFVGGQYKYFEDATHKTLASIIKNNEEIIFEIRDVVTVNPIDITLNNANIEMVNGNKDTYTKIYDGTPDAQFKYIGDKTEGGSVINNIINNEAEIVINATYNSQNAGGNQIIKFNSASVKANKAVNEFSENNYNLINNLEPITNATIDRRPLYIDTIDVKDIEWKGAKWDELNDNYDATFNDIETLVWRNGDGSDPVQPSGFIADDKRYISIKLNGITYNQAKQSEVVGFINSVTSIELEYSKLRGIMNYYVVDTDITYLGNLIRKNEYINLKPILGIGAFNNVDKTFDDNDNFININDLNNEAKNSFGIVPKGELSTYFNGIPAENSIDHIRVYYATKHAGSTKLMFEIVTSDLNVNLINDGKDSINATITPAVINYELLEWKMPYGTRELEPQFKFTFNGKEVFLNKEDGLLYNDEKYNTVLPGLTILNMPVLPECTKVDDKSYKNVNNGGVTDFKFVKTGEETAVITVVSKEVFVYGPTGMTKRYGELNPGNISLQYCDKDGGKAFVGLDSAATILKGDIKGSYVIYSIKDEISGSISYIYGLKVEFKNPEYNSEVEGSKEWIELGGLDENGIIQNETFTLGNYTFKLRYPVGSQEYIAEENQLVVTAPQIPFTISEVYTTSYDGTNKLQNIVNGNILDKEQFDFTYYVDGQETPCTSLKNVKDFALNGGVYQVKVYAKHKSLSGNTEGQNEDWKVFKAPEEGYQLTVGKGVAKTHCDLTINPSDPGFDLNKVEIGVGSSITKDNIIAKLLEEYVENVQVPKDKDNKSIIDLLKDNIDITLEYREGTGFTPIEGTDNRILKAGTYKIKVNFTRPETDDSPLYNFIQNAPAEIVKTIESIKVYIKQITLPEGFIEFKTDSKYIVPEFIEVEDRTDLDYIADELAVLYLGGPLQKYSTTINQTGTYEYKVVVIEDGKENLGYTVLFENGSPAIGQGLKIARKTISGIDGTANNKIESENLIEGVENLFVETMTEPSGSKWDIINRNVNALSTLKTDKSRLTAIVNIQAQNSNGKAVTSDIDNVKLTVKVPSKLSSEKSLQVFYIKYENGVGTLVELNTNEYDLNGDQLVIKNTALQNGAKELVFVSEDIFVMPTWAIVIITLAGVALISCIIAVAVKSIKGRRR